MDEFDPTDWPEFIELPGFTRAWVALGLYGGDLRALQAAILNGPERHPVVSGTGGLRKLRFARPGERRGKSGAHRVSYACYYPGEEDPHEPSTGPRRRRVKGWSSAGCTRGRRGLGAALRAGRGQTTAPPSEGTIPAKRDRGR